jgi:hypothetical protein
MPDEMQTPAATLLQMLRGYWVSQGISVAAELGLADLIAGGTSRSTDLARAASADPESVLRLMRALSAVGLFARNEDDSFALTPLSDLLRTDHPRSLRAAAIMLGQPWLWRSWEDLLETVRSGEPAFPRVFGTTLFQHLEHDPVAGRLFDDAMTALSAQTIPAIVQAADFTRFGTIVDVGGGAGSLLLAMLERAPGARGVLFDMPEVAETAARNLVASGLEGRCNAVGGNMFDAVPAGGDLYVLKNVLHDWNDDSVRAILTNCRAAMAAGAMLMIIETILPDRPAPAPPFWMDLHMMVQLGGRERTAAQLQDLLATTGFSLVAITPTTSPQSIVEAVAVSSPRRSS